MRVVEKAAREGGHERVLKWGGELVELVRARGKRPVYVARKDQETDSKSKGNKGDPKKLTKKPSLKEDPKAKRESKSRPSVQSGEEPILNEDLSPEQAALEQKRVAAASTLQKHLSSRLPWSRDVRRVREWTARNGAWIARLHIALGLAQAETKPTQTSAAGSGKSSPESELKRSDSNPRPSRPPTASTGGKSKKGKGDVSKSATPVPAEEAPDAGVKARGWWAFTPPAAVHFSRAGQHGRRAGAPTELRNAVRCFCNLEVTSGVSRNGVSSGSVMSTPLPGAPSRPSIAEEGPAANGVNSPDAAPRSSADAPRGASDGLAKAAYLLASALADVSNGSSDEDPETAAEAIGFGEKALRALAAERRWTRVLELGMALTAGTSGTAAERILVLMVTSAKELGESGCRELGVSAGVLARDLEGVLRVKPPAVEAIEACRKQWEDFVRSGGKKWHRTVGPGRWKAIGRSQKLGIRRLQS